MSRCAGEIQQKSGQRCSKRVPGGEKVIVVDTSVFLDELFRFDQKRHGKARILFRLIKEKDFLSESASTAFNKLSETGEGRCETKGF